MSKTVRFKLTGREADYVQKTVNIVRHYGGKIGDVQQLAKSSLMEACIRLNGKINEAIERAEKAAASGEEGNTDVGAVDQAETTDGATADAVSADGSGDTEAEPEGAPAEEAGGDDVASRDGGE